MKKLLKHKIFLLGTAALLSMTACEDFLEYSETSSTNEQLAFANFESSTKVAMNAYTYLRDNFGGAMRSSGCDESQYVWGQSYIHRYYNGSWSQFNTIDDVWRHYYNGIYACNNFLKKGADLTFEEYQYTEDYITKMINYKPLKWELRVLRAFYHFELVKRYGNIPVVESLLTKEEANQVTPTKAKDVINWIAQECRIAFEELPEDYLDREYNNQEGRVNKLFAKALEAKALLYGASPLFNEGLYDQAMLRESAKASLYIINEMEADGVSLANINYKDLWESSGDTHAKCKEIIAKIKLNNRNNFERENFPFSVEGGKTGNCPTQNLVDAYDMQSGFTYDPQNPYLNRDQRFYETIVYNGSEWAYDRVMDISYGGRDGLPANGATPTGYYLRKFAIKNTNLSPEGTTKHKMIWILFRLGEVYLNYAEAVSQINGVIGVDGELTLSAVEAVNKVRSRKGLTIDPISESVSLEEFMTLYKKERMVELAFEDHRFWDIRRWMIGESTVAIKSMSIEKQGGVIIYTPVIDNTTRNWDDKYYLYPMSQIELDINTNLNQNKGW